MFRLTLSQFRHSIRRLSSAGLAIAIGAAFVAATLIAGDVLNHASVEALSTGAGDADLIVEASELDPARAAAIDALPGVAATHGVLSVYVQIEDGGASTFVALTPAAADPGLGETEIVAGDPPRQGQIALTENLAERLRVGIGDQIPISRSVRRVASDGEVSFEGVLERVQIAGLLQDPSSPFVGTDVAIGDPDQVLHWAADNDREGQVSYERLLLRLAPGATAPDVSEQATSMADGLEVSTREEYAEARAAQLTGDGFILAAIGLAFGAVALLVAGLVIANTFSVVVAQRTRTLALLRCVGANRRQLRRSVLLEALVLAAIAALGGIGVGLGLAQATLSVLAATGATGLPTTIAPGLPVVLVPLVTAVLVTTVAALVPARAASRVAPLAAMRPSDVADAGGGAGRRRKLAASLLIVAGLAMLAGGPIVASASDGGVGLLLGVLGGGLSFVGVVLAAVFWVPALVGLAANVLVRRGGATASLAAANSLRNPRRTAATSSALLIGVTLVAMMSSGASFARESFDREFDRTYPVDAELHPFEGAADPSTLPAARLAALRALDGVAAAAGTADLSVRISTGDEAAILDATVVDPDEARPVVRDPERLADLGDGVLVMPEHLAIALGFDGQTVSTTPVDVQDETVGSGVELRVETRPVGGAEVLLSRATADRFDLDVPSTGAWVRFADGAEVPTVVRSVQVAVADDDLLVRAAAVERDAFDQIVSTMLRVVVGLLGVAVVIAVIGVANTLSLSVIERGRESATLRAIGLTRRQLRRTIAIEALLIAGVGAVIGSVLGTFYGYIGSLTVLGDLADGVPLAIPWLQLAALIAVALLAGVTASVLPGRRAARTSPVAALAAE